ncbi:MAG: OmpA family protein [Saprospiraceae bacterium]
MGNWQSIFCGCIWLVVMTTGPISMAQLQLQSERIIVKNETLVNSDQLEFSPVFFKNGIVFISTRHDGLLNEVEDTRINLNTMSIYRSKRDAQGILQAAQPMGGDLISSLHEGPVSFDQTAETIYFTRNDTDRKAEKDGLVKLRIYSASKDSSSGTWENLQLLPFNIEEYNAAHPSLSVDGDKLYYASDREDGFGGMDIYVVEREGDEWGVPRNLGPSVNTPANEVFPFIHADGTLYFSSNGHAGQGGLDIYLARESNGAWTKAVNIGTAFNTERDDFGLVVDRDNRNGYFSSNRPGGLGADDIYSFHIQNGDPVELASTGSTNGEIAILVKDANGNPLPNTVISYLNLDEIILSSIDSDEIVRLGVSENGNELVFKLDNAEQTNKGLTNVQGLYDLQLKDGKYVLKVAKEGYLPQQFTFASDNLPEDLVVTLQTAVDCVPFAGSVLDNQYNRPISGATVVVRDNDTGEEITITTDERGQYDYCLKCNKSYSVLARKKGVTSVAGQVSTKDKRCDKSLKLGTALYLDAEAAGGAPIAAGTVINLEHIYYNFDDASLRPDARHDLDLAVDFLRLYPNVNVELGAHTDARGSSSYNQNLSQRRADKAVSYVVSKGIEVNRIIARGYGEARLKNDCTDGARCSETAHQQNRRTEITILNNDGTIAAASYARPVNDRAANTGSSSEDRRISTSPVVRYEGSEGQEFMVIAGTFRNTSNAEERLEEVRNLGYYNAKVVQLDTSPYYHAVVVDQFTSERQLAEQLVSTLEQQHRLNAYVRKVK